ncbi:MAG: OmpA family protein [Flavobacteriales bacterium]|nr:OmpA family protein [Flavobacteriales bacterium]
MNVRVLLFHLLLCLAFMEARAQGNADPYVREGDRYYQQMAYARAAAEYRKAVELGAVNEHVTKRLADCSMRLGDTAEAERWYATVVKFMNREPNDLYQYAEALKSNGRYQEAEEWMDRYLASLGTEGGPKRSNISGFARKFQQDEARFTVTSLPINTPQCDMAPTWLGMDRVVFSSARQFTVGVERRAAWNDQPFLDLFVARVTVDGGLADVAPLEGQVNSKFHEGPATADVSGNTLWFTRNSYFKGRSTKSSNGVTRLAIYKARRTGDGWGDLEQFLYNNSEVSIAHPALSSDARKLFFVSDMPGGYGGTDIYVCREQGGQWSEPENLGPAINTPFNESFPFIAADGTLFFASNGHPGLGGLDVFAALPGTGGTYSGVINVGAPVNGPKDDFGFIIDATGSRGYFTSNRPGGMGDDDIYAFNMIAPLEQRFLCTGLVIDDEYETPVVDAEVQLLDANGALVAATRTDERGEYSFTVQKNSEYKLVARMKGRFEGEQHLSTENIDRQQIMSRDIHLVPDAGVWLRGVLRIKDKPGFLAGAKLSVVNMSSFFSESFMSTEGGDFNIRLATNEEFEVLIEKPGFFSQSVPVSTVGMKRGIIDLNDVRDLRFEPLEVGVPVGFRYVRWPTGGNKLDPLARTELDAFAERLLVNPSLKVEIAVHSDTRGDASANLSLTQKQAQSIVDHLVAKGVPKERLTAKGYGSERPRNHCVAGVSCTEEEHAENRRNEWTVTAILQ